MLPNIRGNLIRNNQPRSMSRLDLLRLKASPLPPSLLNHQLLHKQRNGPIILTQKIRGRNIHISSPSRGRVLRRPRMRAQCFRPLPSIRDIMKEEREWIGSRDCSILFLFRTFLVSCTGPD